MERISLLPPEIKEVRKARQRQSRLFLLFLISIIILVAVNLFFIVNAYFVREELKSLQKEIEIIDDQAESLIEYERLYDNLVRSERLVGNAMGSLPLWGQLLHDIGQNLPVGTQLTELRLNYSNQSGTLYLRGSNYDYRNQAAMLNQLQNLSQLDQVKIQSSTVSTEGSRDVVQFVVDSVLLTGPEFLSENQDGE